MQVSQVKPVVTCPPCIECTPMPPPERKVERVPFQRKVIEYEEYEYEEKIPKRVARIEYDEVKKIQRVPVEKVVTDYYAVEVMKQMVPQVQQEKKTEIVPVQRIVQKAIYTPVVKKSFYTSGGQLIQESKLNDYMRLAGPPQSLVQPIRSSIDESVRLVTPPQPKNSSFKYEEPTTAGKNLLKSKDDYQRLLRSIGLGDYLTYSGFQTLLSKASGNRVPESVAGSIWDRAAQNEKAHVNDLASSMYQISRDSKHIKNILSNLS